MSADVDPAGGDGVCGALGCRRTDDLAVVTGADGRRRTLCPAHREAFGRDRT